MGQIIGGADKQAEIGTRVVSWLLYDLGAGARSPEVVKVERHKEWIISKLLPVNSGRGLR